MLALAFYDVVLAVHIMAVVVAFGVIFAYPVIVPWMRRTHPAAMPSLHGAQVRVGRMVISPGMVLVLAAGIYLASKADVWSEAWVSVPLVILVIIGGLGGAFFTPTEKRLAELSERDLAGGGTLGAEYDALLARWRVVASVAALLVLVAIFFMAAKP
ncbi:DUF2269 family protein [Baekduia soli]|uniref:DUF2269 family protein n=1 Tax=Baekduia soli TaxID=496014 RepID=A0A5B8TZY7_9ACTN|nr:DUF2269 family protein [Baekduia soli]QEC46286.1 DUF2269 family protein [Baekduia soli]